MRYGLPAGSWSTNSTLGAGANRHPVNPSAIHLNRRTDFEWMDSWQVYSKTRAAHAANETSTPRLRGDALLVEKSEAASALIYWKGKRYVWLQQGD